MHEMLHWASGTRLPIVMANVNRALGAPFNIWGEQSDSLSQRDTGWLQIYCESNQEVLDTVIQAFKIAEEVLLPVMVVVDGFFLSHTADPVDVPDAKTVDQFLPAFKPRHKLSTAEPHTFNISADPSLFISFKHEAQKSMEEAKKAAARVDREFKARFGRGYGLLEKYRCQDAEVIFFTMGTAASTAREVIEDFRREGKKVGLCRLRLFRPSPVEELTRFFAGIKKVAVLDRDNSLGAGGIVAQELKAALYAAPRKPKIYEFIAGLGGKDITPETIREAIAKTLKQPNPGSQPVWMGVEA